MPNFKLQSANADYSFTLRKVYKFGIRFNGILFWGPELVPMLGMTVLVKQQQTDSQNYIIVLDEDFQFFCNAYPLMNENLDGTVTRKEVEPGPVSEDLNSVSSDTEAQIFNPVEIHTSTDIYISRLHTSVLAAILSNEFFSKNLVPKWLRCRVRHGALVQLFDGRLFLVPKAMLGKFILVQIGSSGDPIALFEEVTGSDGDFDENELDSDPVGH